MNAETHNEVGKYRLFVLGDAGSGKTTLGHALDAALGLSGVFGVRAFFASPLAQQFGLRARADEARRASTWLPDDLVLEAFGKWLDEGREDGFVCDGFPGSPAQLTAVVHFLGERQLSVHGIVLLRASAQVACLRAMQRVVCSECDGLPEPAERNQPVDACRRCGQRLTRRDDTVEAFQTRYGEYRERSERLTMQAANLGITAVEFNADSSQQRLEREVTRRIRGGRPVS